MTKSHGSFMGTYSINAVFSIVVIATEFPHAVKSLRELYADFWCLRVFGVVPAKMDDKERWKTENDRFLAAFVVRPAQIAVPVYILRCVVIRQKCLEVDVLAGAHGESEAGVRHGLDDDRPLTLLAGDDVEVLDVEVL